MVNKKAIKVAGFVGALCASAALVATAANGTGAYFTSSQDGSFHGNSGHLTLVADPNTTTTLNFADLMPGTDQTKSITYTTDSSSGAEDVWLALPDDAGYQAFTGAADNGSGGGLGRFGHFVVTDNNASVRFQSRNLANEPAGNPYPSCGIDANGDGGSDAASTATSSPPICGAPHYIKLASNVPNGNRTVQLTFGLSGRQTVQNQPTPLVNFKIVGTQVGISPSAGNF